MHCPRGEIRPGPLYRIDLGFYPKIKVRLRLEHRWHYLFPPVDFRRLRFANFGHLGGWRDYTTLNLVKKLTDHWLRQRYERKLYVIGWWPSRLKPFGGIIFLRHVIGPKNIPILPKYCDVNGRRNFWADLKFSTRSHLGNTFPGTPSKKFNGRKYEHHLAASSLSRWWTFSICFHRPRCEYLVGSNRRVGWGKIGR